MKKLIIAIVMGFMALTMNGQNYFSNITIVDEFGKGTETDINGRIYINDSTIIIKTPKGVYDILEVKFVDTDGTKDNPSEINGNFYYATQYYCRDHNNQRCIFAQRTFVTQYTHDYKYKRWVIWRCDENNEVVETVIFSQD